LELKIVSVGVFMNLFVLFISYFSYPSNISTKQKKQSQHGDIAALNNEKWKNYNEKCGTGYGTGKTDKSPFKKKA
jgi:hypothetical protein